MDSSDASTCLSFARTFPPGVRCQNLEADDSSATIDKIKGGLLSNFGSEVGGRATFRQANWTSHPRSRLIVAA